MCHGASINRELLIDHRALMSLSIKFNRGFEMTIVALFGAGGKMGQRLSQNMVGSLYKVRHVEVSEAGQARVKANFGADCWTPDDAISGANIVVLAVPDTAIGKVAATIVDKLASGTMVMILDAAAAYAGHMPKRDDVTYFVTHPCHPPIFNDETDMAAKRDFPRVKHWQKLSGHLLCVRIGLLSIKWRCWNLDFQRRSAVHCWLLWAKL
jgi:hypothetical protein